MKRQVIVTNWANGEPPRVEYVDEGPGRAESRPANMLDTPPYSGREAERGGRVRAAASDGRGMKAR